MAKNPFDSYVSAVEKDFQTGRATEHTHRPALKKLLEALAPGVTATNDPKRIECGAPDLHVSRDSGHGPITIGQVETKDIGKNLDEVLKTEQLERYLAALPNLVLTDYLEFRWLVDGALRLSARLARPDRQKKLREEPGGNVSVNDLLDSFLSHRPQPISTPKELAVRMARLTHEIREIVVAAFEKGVVSETLSDLRRSFETVLLPDLTDRAFADMYAQTLSYGLFAARCNHTGSERFRRLGAAAEIPKTNPLLRQLFETVTGTALDEEPYVGFVDDLAQLLADSDIEAILSNFGKRTARQDPVVHFYETYLSEYDPKLRETRGVYYTPEPVVSYIVRSVDHLLRTRFNCESGLADTARVTYQKETQTADKTQIISEIAPKVLVLDPACGTGTFLYAVVDLIRSEFAKQGNAGLWSGYVRDHLLPRLFGFELLMAPYAVAHFKLGMQLAAQDMTLSERSRWAYDFSGAERLGVYLTNTLDEAERLIQEQWGFSRTLASEANAASRIKRDLPIMVVLGNPPYSGHSANRSWELENGKKVHNFIGRLLEDYYKVDDQPLGERNPKWLQDDYVKFIRFAQWRIEQTGAGVLAFITNHSYIDSPTFRGMRQQLMRAFTDVYILDLHGNAKKKERSPDGSKDENVFDIQQGVAIGIFIKEKGKSGPAAVHHANFWGTRGGKHESLFAEDISNTTWAEVVPQSPFYLFTPQDADLQREYERWWKITEIMPVNVLGFQTHRDHFAVDFDRDEMRRRIQEMRSTRLDDEECRAKYEVKDNRDWSLAGARTRLRADRRWEERLIRCLYRPFDWRWCYFSEVAMDYPRRELLDHVWGRENYCLLASRQQATVGYRHCWVAKEPPNDCVVSTTSREANQAFLLYTYPPSGEHPRANQEEADLHVWPSGKDGRRPNFMPAFVREMEGLLRLRFIADGRGDLKETVGPEDILHYMYAVFHSPTYRTRYAEYLKIDYPRLPLTSDMTLFRSLCHFGSDLIGLHLLDSPRLMEPGIKYPVAGSNVVEKGHPKYLAPGAPEPSSGIPLAAGRVYVNRGDVRSRVAAQYFDGVPAEVWDFHIGGYRVCEKWLKDRQGRTLTFDELDHYRGMVAALRETIRIMAEIDVVIDDHGGWPAAFASGKHEDSR
ncbi:MAG: N-6 DNA methylase [candidate division Zixibacteria bacterium]|nr:N-6 DNA methylase [candidate division Zixibacteria bacterium]